MNILLSQPSEAERRVVDEALKAFFAWPAKDRPSILAQVDPRRLVVRGSIEVTTLGYREDQFNKLKMVAIPSCQDRLFCLYEMTGPDELRSLGYVVVDGKEQPRFSYISSMPSTAGDGDQFVDTLSKVFEVLERLAGFEGIRRVHLLINRDLSQFAVQLVRTDQPDRDLFMPLGPGFGTMAQELLQEDEFHASLGGRVSEYREKVVFARTAYKDLMSRLAEHDESRAELHRIGVTDAQLFDLDRRVGRN